MVRKKKENFNVKVEDYLVRCKIGLMIEKFLNFN